MPDSIDLDLPFDDLVRLHPDHIVVASVPGSIILKERERLILVFQATDYEGWEHMNLIPIALEAVTGRLRKIAKDNNIYVGDYFCAQPERNDEGGFDIPFVFATIPHAMLFKMAQA